MTQQKKTTVLVIGSKSDPVIQFFINQKMYQGFDEVAFHYIYQECFLKTIHLCDERWWFQDQASLEHSTIDGVWNRMVDPVKSNQTLIHEMEAFTIYLMNSVYPRVLNRPMAGLSNQAKLYQISLLVLKHIQKIDSIMASNYTPELLGINANAIYKSASGVRSIVRQLKPNDRHRWITEPVLFQKQMMGDNIRVHVIDQVVIACHCQSDCVDYRYAQKTEIMRIELPLEIANECVEISQQLSLVFTGIDLILQDATYYLLEVNPAPGYAYFDIDGAVSRQLAQYFTRKTKHELC